MKINKNSQFGDKPLLFAHRGVSSIAPENTLSSFDLSLKLNIPGIELDIHRCATGELVVFHDHNTKRITGIDAQIETLTISEIKALDAGSWKSKEYIHEKIPTLEEVFSLVNKKAIIDIEIKYKGIHSIGIENDLLDLIYKYDMQNHVCISSFNPFALKHFKAKNKTIPTGIIYCSSKELPFFLRNGQGAFLAHADYLKPEYIKINSFSSFYHKNISHKEFIPWTVDSIEEAEKLLRLGASGIISNKPQDLISLFK